MKIATAQFENKSCDKIYNLKMIRGLSEAASMEDALVVSFHECSITGYNFARKIPKNRLLDLAEFIPGGPSIEKLVEIAKESRITILAGLFEKDETDKIYNTYVCVDQTPFRTFPRKFS